MIYLEKNILKSPFLDNFCSFEILATFLLEEKYRDKLWETHLHIIKSYVFY